MGGGGHKAGHRAWAVTDTAPRPALCRDLGTSLGRLQVLWLARCGLADLDGISSFPALKVGLPCPVGGRREWTGGRRRGGPG